MTNTTNYNLKTNYSIRKKIKTKAKNVEIMGFERYFIHPFQVDVFHVFPRTSEFFPWIINPKTVEEMWRADLEVMEKVVWGSH